MEEAETNLVKRPKGRPRKIAETLPTATDLPAENLNEEPVVLAELEQPTEAEQIPATESGFAGIMIPGERIELSRDEYKIEAFHNSGNQLGSLLNEVLAEYRALELGELTLSDVQTMVQNGGVEELVRTKVAGNEPRTIGGLIFAAEQVKKMVQIPDISGLDRALQQFKSRFDLIKSQQSAYIRLPDFEISNGTAKISQPAVQKMEDTYIVYAATPEEKEAYVILQDIQKKLQYLSEKHHLHAILSTRDRVVLQQVYEPGGIITRINQLPFKSAFSRYGY